MTLDPHSFRRHWWRNTLLTFALMAVAGTVMGLLALWLVGPEMMVLAITMVVVLYWLNPGLSPDWVLRWHRCVPLSARQAPRLHQWLTVLSRTGQLSAVPRLYLQPTAVPNAMTLGDEKGSVLVLSRGLLEALDEEALAGVLAHEVAHLVNGDIRVLRYGVVVASVVHALALTALLLLAFSLPDIWRGEVLVPLPVLAMVILAPLLVDLGQLALSRTREYRADMTAAMLLGDPGPLIRALSILDFHHRDLLRWVLRGRQGYNQGGVWLKTHPETVERIRRLEALIQ